MPVNEEWSAIQGKPESIGLTNGIRDYWDRKLNAELTPSQVDMYDTAFDGIDTKMPSNLSEGQYLFDNRDKVELSNKELQSLQVRMGQLRQMEDTKKMFSDHMYVDQYTGVDTSMIEDTDARKEMQSKSALTKFILNSNDPALRSIQEKGEEYVYDNILPIMNSAFNVNEGIAEHYDAVSGIVGGGRGDFTLQFEQLWNNSADRYDFNEAMAGAVSSDNMEQIDSLLASQSKFQLQVPYDTSVGEFAGTMTDSMLFMGRSAFDPDNLLAIGAGAGAGSATGIGALAGAGWGWRAGFTHNNYQQYRGETYAMMRNEGISHEISSHISVGAGVIMAGVENIGMAHEFGAGDLIKGYVKEFGKDAIIAMSKEGVEASFKGYIKKATTKGALKGVVVEGLKEGVEEGIQTATQFTAVEAGKVREDNPNITSLEMINKALEADWTEAQKEEMEKAVVFGMLGGQMMSAGGHVMKTTADKMGLSGRVKANTEFNARRANEMAVYKKKLATLVDKKEETTEGETKEKPVTVDVGNDRQSLTDRINFENAMGDVEIDVWYSTIEQIANEARAVSGMLPTDSMSRAQLLLESGLDEDTAKPLTLDGLSAIVANNRAEGIMPVAYVEAFNEKLREATPDEYTVDMAETEVKMREQLPAMMDRYKAGVGSARDIIMVEALDREGVIINSNGDVDGLYNPTQLIGAIETDAKSTVKTQLEKAGDHVIKSLGKKMGLDESAGRVDVIAKQLERLDHITEADGLSQAMVSWVRSNFGEDTVVVDGKKNTLSSLIESGTLTEDEAKKLIRDSGMNIDEVTDTVLKSVSARGLTRDGMIHLYYGYDASTVIEESSEMAYKGMMAQDSNWDMKITAERVGWRNHLKKLIEGTTGKEKADYQELLRKNETQSNVEWTSDRAVEWRLEVKPMHKTLGMDIRSFFNAIQAMKNYIVGRALALRKFKESGKMSREFKQFLDSFEKVDTTQTKKQLSSELPTNVKVKLKATGDYDIETNTNIYTAVVPLNVDGVIGDYEVEFRKFSTETYPRGEWRAEFTDENGSVHNIGGEYATSRSNAIDAVKSVAENNIISLDGDDFVIYTKDQFDATQPVQTDVTAQLDMAVPYEEWLDGRESTLDTIHDYELELEARTKELNKVMAKINDAEDILKYVSNGTLKKISDLETAKGDALFTARQNKRALGIEEGKRRRRDKRIAKMRKQQATKTELMDELNRLNKGWRARNVNEKKLVASAIGKINKAGEKLGRDIYEETIQKIEDIKASIERDGISAKIDKLFDKYRPKSGEGKFGGGQRGADIHTFLTEAERIFNLSQEEYAKELNTAVDSGDNAKVSMLNTFNQLGGMDSVRLEQIAELVEYTVRQGVLAKKAIAFMDEGRKKWASDAIVKSMQGGTGKPRAKGKDWVIKLGNSMGWNQNIRSLMDRLDAVGGLFEGTASEFVMRNINKMTNTLSKNLRTQQDIMSAMVAKHIGKDGELNVKTLESFRKSKETGILVDGKDLKISAGDAITIRNLAKNEAGRKALEKSKFTDETIKQVEEYLATFKGAVALADDMLVFYREYYPRINEVFVNVNGVNLKQEENYTPLRRSYIADQEVTDLLKKTGAMDATGLVNKALVDRVENDNSIDMENMDAFDIMTSHVMMMENYIAKTEGMKEIREVIQGEDVQKWVKHYFGNETNVLINKLFTKFEAEGIQNVMRIPVLDAWINGFIRSKMALNLGAFTKQLTSAMAYMIEMPPTEWGVRTSEFFARPDLWKERMKELTESSEMMEDRYKANNINEALRNLEQSHQFTEFSAKSTTKSLENWAMSPTKLGDKIAIVSGGWAMYSYKKDQYIKKGMSEADAKAKAIEDFEIITSHMQQSGKSKDLGMLQQSGTFSKLFTMFNNSQLSYLRMAMSGASAIAKGKGSKAQNAGAIVMSQMILPWMFAGGGLLNAVMMGSMGAERDDAIERDLTMLMFAPLTSSGIPIVRDMVSASAYAMAGLPKPPFLGQTSISGSMYRFGMFANMLRDEEWLESMMQLTHVIAEPLGLPSVHMYNMIEDSYEVIDNAK